MNDGWIEGISFVLLASCTLLHGVDATVLASRAEAVLAVLAGHDERAAAVPSLIPH